MGPKTKQDPESVVREIKRNTRRKFNSEEKIRIVLEGLRGEDSIASICRKEGIATGVYYKWSKAFLEAGKRKLNGDTIREADSSEVSVTSAQLQRVCGSRLFEVSIIDQHFKSVSPQSHFCIFPGRHCSRSRSI
jgi:transposase